MSCSTTDSHLDTRHCDNDFNDWNCAWIKRTKSISPSTWMTEILSSQRRGRLEGAVDGRCPWDDPTVQPNDSKRSNEAFKAVVNGEAMYGVVPIENSASGRRGVSRLFLSPDGDGAVMTNWETSEKTGECVSGLAGTIRGISGPAEYYCDPQGLGVLHQQGLAQELLVTTSR